MVRRRRARLGSDLRRALWLSRRYLRFGTRSTDELREYLQGRGLSKSLVDEVIAGCLRDDLLDDRACSKLWATRLAERGYAWAIIRQQLLAKGLREGLVDEAIEPLKEYADDAARARTLAQSHLQGQDERSRSRVARFLAQRGFDQDLIEQVLVELLPPA